VKSLVRGSTHPLSGRIYDAIGETELLEVIAFKELAGKGIEGWINHKMVRVGAALYVADKHNVLHYDEKSGQSLKTKIFVSIDGHIKGFFTINNTYRGGLELLTSQLKQNYSLSVLTGDNSGERENLLKYFDDDAQLNFNNSPADKLDYVKSKQGLGEKVLMIGDGLNDAGALKQSDVGVAVTEDVSNFSPSCDAILDASVFSRLGTLLGFTKTTKKIIILSFIISILYNIVGVTLAFRSEVSPIMAAVLMPVSSITVVLFTVLSTNFMAKRRGL
jgi:Cu+-exporting ATPase